MPHAQFDFLALPEDSSDAKSLPSLARWINGRLQKLGGTLRGPTAFDAGISGTTKRLRIHQVDQTQLELTDNCTVTLDIVSRAGAVGDVELTQDATGSRTVTWVNALWAASTPPTIASGATTRTLIRFVNVGGAWVGAVHAANY